MTRTAQALKAELALLPQKDRAELAYFLIRKLDGKTYKPSEANRITRTAKELKARVSVLSGRDGEELVCFLLDSLGPDGETWGPEEGDAFVAELDRRMEEVRSGKDKGKPVEQVFAELREKYPCSRFASSAAQKKSSKKRLPISRNKKRA